MKPIEYVREGMDVFNSSGARIGTVARVKMGDPEAITAQGQQPDQTGGLIGALMSAVDGSPSLPEERKNRLLRLGYVEINGPGIGNHQYESAEAINRVTGDSVFLKTPTTTPTA
ncbi:hypothetical protein [Arthrobacter sp. Leaf234]|uniref:hypothetical protein n=1 Tax=Arthrobacter sp. Leaf234 TaxID=1736303 RepID=UPI0012F7A5DA|nr:hypothetical protein [Arthrobacter sp. Leaf234]